MERVLSRTLRRLEPLRPYLCLGHLRRRRFHPRAHPRSRRRDQPRHVDDGDGAPHLRRAHPRPARRDRHPLRRRRDREHPRPGWRPAERPRPPARRAHPRDRSRPPRSRARRLLGGRRRAPGAAPAFGEPRVGSSPHRREAARGRLRDHAVLLRRPPLLRARREPAGARGRQAGDRRDHAGHEPGPREAHGRDAGLGVPAVARREARGGRATTRPRCAASASRRPRSSARRCSTAGRRGCTSTR